MIFDTIKNLGNKVFNKQMQQKKLGLSLRGGGMRTTSYLGVLQALEEENIKVHCLVGASGGAVVAGSYATGKSPFEILEHFKTFKIFSLFNPKSWLRLSPIDTNAWVKHAKKMTGDLQFSDAKIPVWIQATNIKTGEIEYLHEGNMANAAIASSSLPWLMKPFKLNNKKYLDGEISAGYGAKILRDNGAEVVIALSCTSNTIGKSMGNKLAMPLTIAINNSLEKDLELNPVDLLINNLGSGAGIFSKNKIDKFYDQGYKEARERMPEIKKLLFD